MLMAAARNDIPPPMEKPRAARPAVLIGCGWAPGPQDWLPVAKIKAAKKSAKPATATTIGKYFIGEIRIWQRHGEAY